MKTYDTKEPIIIDSNEKFLDMFGTNEPIITFKGKLLSERVLIYENKKFKL